MVVGETEVLGQAKQAYANARETGGAGPLLHRLFQRAFRVAKEVRTNTDITRGAVRSARSLWNWRENFWRTETPQGAGARRR
jgi:glutamyl-tRNA reductase